MKKVAAAFVLLASIVGCAPSPSTIDAADFQQNIGYFQGSTAGSVAGSSASTTTPNVPAANPTAKPTLKPTPTQAPTASPTPRPTKAPNLPDVRGLDPDSYFISQLLDPVWNPTAQRANLNCGPASLAMALRAFGMRPPGATGESNVQELIELTRIAMTGKYDPTTVTWLSELAKGAQACGAQERRYFTVAELKLALHDGKYVILNGNPVVYCNRLPIPDYARSNGAHFILVTGIDDSYAYVNDPLSHVGNIRITLDEFAAFTTYSGTTSGSGIAIWQ